MSIVISSVVSIALCLALLGIVALIALLWLKGKDHE